MKLVTVRGLRVRDLVILNGDEGAVRDRTTAVSFDVVDGNAQCCMQCAIPGHRTAALRASYGPSEGYRPPQDDIAKARHRESMTSRTPR